MALSKLINVMLQLIKYHLLKFYYPDSADYISMGFGIKARAVRCRNYWAKHLELSKDFIINSIQKLPNNSEVSVLGAGHLLDFPIEQFANYKKVKLVDADPSCRKFWKKSCKDLFIDQHEFIIADVTGSISAWTKELELFIKSSSQTKTENDIATFISTLKMSDNLNANISADLIVSLNLLSQIPIYWRDRVVELLERKLGIKSNESGEFSDNLQQAINSSMALLQSDHLVQIFKCAKKGCIIITDKYFHYYQKDKSHWQTEPALFFNQFANFKDWQLQSNSAWLWHIAPQDIEQKNYGIIHEVEARFYLKRKACQ